MNTIITIKNLYKSHGSHEVFSLHMEELSVQKGELVALVGPSGCGKSTALDILSTALEPQYDQQSVFSLCLQNETIDILELWQKNKQSTLAKLRKNSIGYILQTGGLLPFLSGYDNIALSCAHAGQEKNIDALAQLLDISHLLHKKPALMSVGERQRFAIARALIHEPSLILADEPVASLDPYNATLVLDLFTAIAKEKHITVVMVSHFPENAKAAGFRLIPTTVRREENTIHAHMGHVGHVKMTPPSQNTRPAHDIAPVGTLGKGRKSCS